MNCILKYQGTSEPDMQQIDAFLEAHHVQVLDNSLWPETTLLELDDSGLAALQAVLGEEWVVYPEKLYQVPSPRKTIKKYHR